MIGWRPVVVTLIAGCVIAVAVAHAIGSAPCADADSLRRADLLSAARSSYVDVLKETSPPACAGSGLDAVTERQCTQAALLVTVSAEDAKKSYLEIATTEPVRAAADCARTGLRDMGAK